MNPLHKLADACGVAREWRDVEGRERQVADSALEAILAALGRDTSSERQINLCLAAVAEREHGVPPMLVVDADAEIVLPLHARKAQVTGEDGVTRVLQVAGDRIGPIAEPGYYDLEFDGHAIRLAVAPAHCPLPKVAGRKPWGISLQIPALRGDEPSPFGTFGELAHSTEALARRGVDAVAINPVHALFPGNGEGFSPYSPSSRLFLNGAMGDPSLLDLPPLPTGAEASCAPNR